MCKDGHPLPDEYVDNAKHLAESVLQPLRDRVGQLDVVSWYRSKAWNDRKGGAKTSAHLTAEGADVSSHVYTATELHTIALAMHAQGLLPALGGIGHYPGKWIHLDTKKPDDGHLRRWEGSGVGDEK